MSDHLRSNWSARRPCNTVSSTGKVLAQLNLSLRTKSEQYGSEALKAIFLLNNTLYVLQGLGRGGLLDALAVAEPRAEAGYRDIVQDYKQAYLNRSRGTNTAVYILCT